MFVVVYRLDKSSDTAAQSQKQTSITVTFGSFIMTHMTRVAEFHATRAVSFRRIDTLIRQMGTRSKVDASLKDFKLIADHNIRNCADESKAARTI
jgi:hypothetical protein